MEIYWFEQCAADVAAGDEWLTAAEAASAAAMRIPKRRDDWRLGRWTAKHAIQAFMQPETVALSDIEIKLAPSGAPEAFFANTRARLVMSLSHRDGRAICAVTSPDAQLGCDLELIEPHSAAFGADYFTASEQEFVSRLSFEHRDAAFTLMWSLKECVLKALQVGLRADTRDVEVSFADIVAFRHSIAEHHADEDDVEWTPARCRTVEGQAFPCLWQRDGAVVRTFCATRAFRLVSLNSTRVEFAR